MLPRHIGHEERSVKLLKGVCERLRVPVDCSELAEVVAREHGNIHRSGDFSAAALVRLLERCDAFRKPQRFGEILLACECDARGRPGPRGKCPYPQRARLAGALAAAQSVATPTSRSRRFAWKVGERMAASRHHRAGADASAGRAAASVASRADRQALRLCPA
jgi:tRNA nucleotidyltransferase (CCA-adding enzyme)